ncbi:MAG: glycosyltransferase family 2 protein [Lachnospiraceae bacterium]|nr:glycosyltransferase family 2 protein [Lachnospiraceae bacterium]
MKLSIIVPVYNMAADGLLQFCMESLLSQTISDYEIIAVDDKSTDQSLAVLREYEEKYPEKVRVIASLENRRQGGAKNLGLRAAKGEWIGFIDSDDWITKDYYEKLLNKAEETGADIVGCNYNITDKQSFEIGKVCRNNNTSQAGVLTEELYKDLIMNPGSMVTKVYRREIFYENGLWFPEYMFYEDNCLAPLTMLCCKHFEYVDEPNYFYYQKPGSTTHHVSLQKCEDRMTAMIYFIEECIKREYLSAYPEEIEYRFTEMFYINTLFSFMLQMPFHKKHLSFLCMLKEGMESCFPDFQENPYFLEKQDAEVKRLVAMHMKSPFRFFWYYEALMTYRKLFRRKAK